MLPRVVLVITLGGKRFRWQEYHAGRGTTSSQTETSSQLVGNASIARSCSSSRISNGSQTGTQSLLARIASIARVQVMILGELISRITLVSDVFRVYNEVNSDITRYVSVRSTSWTVNLRVGLEESPVAARGTRIRPIMFLDSRSRWL